MDEQPDRTLDSGPNVGGKPHEGEQAAPKRTWFLMREAELDWLPVSEAAFLLWVLAFLLLAWLAVALVFVVR